MYRELEDSLQIAMSLNDAGYIALQQGDYERAKPHFEESSALFRKLGVKWHLSVPLLNLGNALLAQGEHERAEPFIKESLALSREVGDSMQIADCLDALAGVAVRRGNAELAGRLLGAAEALHEAVAGTRFPLERALVERYRAAVRSRLGEGAWEAAWAEGQAMTPEEALEYALSGGETAPSVTPKVEQAPAGRLSAGRS